MPKPNYYMQPKTGAEYIDELSVALQEHGFLVDPDPIYEGSDTAAIVFSKNAKSIKKYYDLCEKYLSEEIAEDEFESAKEKIAGLGFSLQDWKHLDLEGEKEYLKDFGIRLKKLPDGYEVSTAAKVPEKELVARWESKGGKHWVELYKHPTGGYSYRAPDAGGAFGIADEPQVMQMMEQKLREGYFTPDSSKHPLKRVR